jgi:transposase
MNARLNQLPRDPAALQAIIQGLHQKLSQQDADLAQRDADLAQRQAVIDQQQQTLEASQARIMKLEQQVILLVRHRYGPRSEKIDANQLLLFGQSILPLTDPEPAASEMPGEVAVNRPRKKGHGRRIIPADLPRQTVVHDVPEDEKTCTDCQSPKVKIREIVTEQLELIEPKLYVLRHVQVVWGCAKGCDGQMQTAEKPAQVVDKGLAGPGLVAHVITGKYADHLPLYRMEGIFARYGIEISRSTMCDWARDVAQLCRPVVELMHKRILTGRMLYTDDTPIPVLDPTRDRTKQGRLWIYLGEPLVPYTVYDYTPNRTREGPQAWLKDYGGYLQCDAYSGYEFAFEKGVMKEVACWAHARRKFIEAKNLAPELCHEALAFITRLYDVEREGKDRALDEAGILALRQEKSVAILLAMEQWMHKARLQVLPKNPAYGALGYLSNQWEALKRYTTRGFLNIDNNPAERALRRVAIGRKNWMFAGSDAGGTTAAILYSLIASAERHELNVEAYLRGLFAQLPGARMSELPRFLPDAWKADLAKEAAAAKRPAVSALP